MRSRSREEVVQQSVNPLTSAAAMLSASPSVSWLQPPPSSAWLVSLAHAATPVQSVQPMVRHSAGAAAARLRKTSDQSTPPHSTNGSPSHAGRAIAPSTANGSAAVTAAAAQQANRLRANSLSQTIQQRRRKRDMARDLWRRMMRLGDADGPTKVGLFLVLAFALWLLFFYTAPTPTTPHLAASSAALSATAAASAVSSGSPRDYSKSAPPVVMVSSFVREYPHDPLAFTQGLLVHQGQLWESTGLYGQSQLRRVDLTSGAVQESWAMPQQYFGEGLTLVGDRLIQLTWQNQLGFIYDLATATHDGPKGQFAFPPSTREGWGIATSPDESSLVMSDGSSTLTFLDPQSFGVQRTVNVRVWVASKRGGAGAAAGSGSGAAGSLQPVRMLNELEWIGSLLYANIWMTTLIAVIDPQTGLVVQWLDLRALQPPNSSADMTLNGIAFDKDKGKLFVTGKLWPKLFEIELPKVEDKASAAAPARR